LTGKGRRVKEERPLKGEQLTLFGYPSGGKGKKEEKQ